jgi:serine/threonine protein kinase
LAAIAGLTELVLLPEKPLIDALRSAAGDPSAEVKAAARKTLKHFIDKGDIRLDQVQDVMQDVDPIQQRIDDILKETVPSRVTIPEFKRTLSLQKELTALAKTKADYKGTEVATKAAEFKAWLESSAVTKLPEEARLDKDFVVTTDGQPPVHTSYRIVDQLGEGGMARVFLAEKVGEPGSRYAIKVLLPGFIKGFRSTHIVEGNIITEMDHPNIVKGYGGGDLEIPGQTARPFFVMEQVQTSLDKVLNRLSDEQKLAVLRQVEEALNFAWSTRKILHRDVKPENILVELDDSGALVKVKLADFGVAKDLGDPESGHTRTGTLKGTVKVTAPEAQAIAGLKHDDREAKLQTAGPLIDIYAWGITAYRIFARQYPPERTCHSELEWSHFCTAQGADLAKYALKMPDVTPPIPAEIWPVIVKATEMNPADRFQSWKDVQTSLSGLTMEIAKTQVGDKPASEGIAALLKSLDGIDGLTLTQTVDLALLVQGKIDELEAKAATVELSAEETAFMARLVDTAPGLQAIIDLKEGGLS